MGDAIAIAVVTVTCAVMIIKMVLDHIKERDRGRVLEEIVKKVSSAEGIASSVRTIVSETLEKQRDMWHVRDHLGHAIDKLGESLGTLANVLRDMQLAQYKTASRLENIEDSLKELSRKVKR